MPKCPLCHEEMDLTCPDYGYGSGAEYACYCNGKRRTYSTNNMNSREREAGLAQSKASRSLSRSNARRCIK